MATFRPPYTMSFQSPLTPQNTPNTAVSALADRSLGSLRVSASSSGSSSGAGAWAHVGQDAVIYPRTTLIVVLASLTATVSAGAFIFPLDSGARFESAVARVSTRLVIFNGPGGSAIGGPVTSAGRALSGAFADEGRWNMDNNYSLPHTLSIQLYRSEGTVPMTWHFIAGAQSDADSRGLISGSHADLTCQVNELFIYQYDRAGIYLG